MADAAAAGERMKRDLMTLYQNPDIQTSLGLSVRGVYTHAEPYLSYIKEYTAQKGVDPGVVMALIGVEQRDNATAGDYSAVSPKGARGLMQLTADTARRFNVNVNDPRDNIRGATDLLAELQDRLGTRDPLFLAAAYNAGDRAARNYSQATYDLPQETKNYLPQFDIAYKTATTKLSPR
jgi:soluble lytic murein transglycosylase-like protein